MERRWMTIAMMTLLMGCGSAPDSELDEPVAVEEPEVEPDVEPETEQEEAEESMDEPELGPIGPDDEPHSLHHRLQLKRGDYVGASVEVKIDEVPDDGLRFFALQVNFADVAWAHGGLQRDPSDGRANWGGLVRGIDYDFEGAEQQVLSAIQNMPGRSSDVTWEANTWYRYEVQRGELETLPPGEYSVLDEEPVMVEEPREMWKWTFTVVEVETGEQVWTQDLYVAHPHITSGTYWTETGYGIECTDRLTIHWRSPLFHQEDGQMRLPQAMYKSMGQSDCPNHATTDMARADHGGEWGTTQWYGVERAEDSADGDLLYYWTLQP